MIDRLFANAPTQPESKLWIWRVLFPPIRAIVLRYIKVDVYGREHVPEHGPYLLVMNHINWTDPPITSLALGTSIRWMAKAEVFHWPIIGFLLRGIGNFPVRRGESDRRAIVMALRVLQSGLPLGVFPEGHRSEDRALLRGQPGVALLATRTDALIVPCGIVGTPGALRPIGRSHAELHFGAPFRVKDLPAEERKDHQAIADAIMRRIAAQLPASMRGVYA